MEVLVGIDEAGFGPILGPLVVSACAFELPENLLKADLWHILRKSTAKNRRAIAGKLLVADSKKAFNRSQGLGHLQRSVLAFLLAVGCKPSNINQLLQAICPACQPRIDTYPWYAANDHAELSANNTDIEIAAASLEKDMNENSMQFLGINARCLDVAYYNRMVENTNNKSSVLFSSVADLINQAFESTSDNLQVLVDRQGGRSRYGNTLRRMFPDFELTVIDENTNCSSYEMKLGNRKMRIHFAVGADERFMPVALASMTSKYLRELLVERINEFFIGHYPTLKPTAGYWQDGQRFIAELEKNNTHLEYDRNMLIRCR